MSHGVDVKTKAYNLPSFDPASLMIGHEFVTPWGQKRLRFLLNKDHWFQSVKGMPI